MVSGGPGDWRSRCRREATPNPVSRTCPSAQFSQDIGGLDVLMDEAALVDLAHSPGDADSEAQEASHLHGCAEQPVERLAAGIFEHELAAPALVPKLQRPHRPCTIQFVLQSVFVGKLIEADWWRVLRGEQHHDHGAAVAVSAQAPTSAEDAFAVLPQYAETVVSLSAEPKRFQLPRSADRLVAAQRES